jgi:hypothetical protein
MQVLRDAGYLDDDGLLPRGKVAQRINGYEIQVAELLFSGVLDADGHAPAGGDLHGADPRGAPRPDAAAIAANRAL